MKIYQIRLLVYALVLLFQGAFTVNIVLGQQRPPLSIDPNEECHIADAVPLLIKNNYKSNGYKLTKLKEKPLIIEETISFNKSFDLRIEQRGCEDLYAKFQFEFKNQADRKLGIKSNLQKAAQTIKNLKLRRDALLNAEELAQISRAMIKHSQKAKPLNQQVICLSKIPNECITDISLKYQFPHLEIFYVTRP
ncbi:MAG: hypothetical protein ABI954_07150 [Pyrinomonadaceae bacterium]